MSIRVTVENLMKSTKLDRASCYGLLRFLESTGIATRSAAPRDPKQRGRSVAVYDLPDAFALRLHSLLIAQDSIDLFAGSSDTAVDGLAVDYADDSDIDAMSVAS